MLAIVLATPEVAFTNTTLCNAPPAALILTPVAIPVILSPAPVNVVALTIPTTFKLPFIV